MFYTISLPFVRPVIHLKPKSAERLAPRVRKVLVLHSGILLDELITLLLGDEPCLQVAVTQMASEESIASLVTSLCPQEIICSGQFSARKFKQALKSLDYPWDVDVVAVSLDSNTLEINGEGRCAFANFRQLVHLIKRRFVRHHKLA